jgi:hypothetical protein
MAEAAGRRLASSGADACGLNHANVFIGDRAMSAWGEEEESRTVMPVLVFCYLFRSLCGAYYMLSNCFFKSLSLLSPEVSGVRCPDGSGSAALARRGRASPGCLSRRATGTDPVCTRSCTGVGVAGRSLGGRRVYARRPPSAGVTTRQGRHRTSNLPRTVPSLSCSHAFGIYLS